MNYVKFFGKIGLIISFLAFVIVFVQNSFNSQLIQDTINYNLIYSYNIENYQNKENFLVIHFKNNGIRSIDSIRINIKSRTNKIRKIFTQDSLNFKEISSDSLKVLQKLTLLFKGAQYPSEYENVIIQFVTNKQLILADDIDVSVNCKFTNGIIVKNAVVANEINYKNLILYIKATNKLLLLISLRIILPLIVISILFLFLYKFISKFSFLEYIKKLNKF